MQLLLVAMVLSEASALMRISSIPIRGVCVVCDYIHVSRMLVVQGNLIYL